MRPSFAIACVPVLTLAASAQTTTRASVSSGGIQANDSARNASVSADGRSVVFESLATNLAASDTNLDYDVFVRDQFANQTLCASVDSAGTVGNSVSLDPRISGDGSRVVFRSFANNLVSNDTNSRYDVFLHDFATGQTSRLSLSSTGAQLPQDSGAPAISGDGRFAAFVTNALVLSGDGNGVEDVFVVELATGVVRCASVQSGGSFALGGASGAPAFSADGRYVAFESAATNLVPGDTNGWTDVFVHDFQTNTTQRVSVDSGGAQVFGLSKSAQLSADGRHVAFDSSAQALDPNDTNGYTDVFVRDLLLGTIERVSLDSGGQQANSPSAWASISGDGRFVAFESSATNLVPGDTNTDTDVFVHDRTSGLTQRASVSTAGAEGSRDSHVPRLSSDGRVVVFHSGSPNLVTPDLNAAFDVFARFLPDPIERFCFGDGSQLTACPCSNFGFPGNGCDNSLGTSGANLTASGATLPDTLMLSVTGELPSSLSIFLQGDLELNPGTWFGDGVRCVGGALKRLYSKNAVNGSVSAPGAGDLGVRARSTQLGDAIPIGSTRFYQVYYRDPDASFCTPPFGNTWNVSSGVRVQW